MRRAERCDRSGQWPLEKSCGTVTLTHEERHRRRARLLTDGGEEILLDLPRAVVLEDGDGLALADGGWIAVRAASEPLLEVRTAAPAQLCRLAWHLGNRHLPAQLEAERILVRNDHVIAAMLEGLGARLRQVQEAFAPELGAYAAGEGHSHRARGPASGQVAGGHGGAKDAGEDD